MSNEGERRTRRTIDDQGQAEHRSLGHVAAQFAESYVEGAGNAAGIGTVGSIVYGAKLAKDKITKKEPPPK